MFLEMMGIWDFIITHWQMLLQGDLRENRVVISFWTEIIAVKFFLNMHSTTNTTSLPGMTFTLILFHSTDSTLFYFLFKKLYR